MTDLSELLTKQIAFRVSPDGERFMKEKEKEGTNENKPLLSANNASINNGTDGNNRKNQLARRYFNFIYFCARYSLLEDMFKYLLVRNEGKFIHPPISLTNSYDIASVQLVENFFGNFLTGTRLISDTLYPAFLFVTLIYDLVRFCFLPQARVGSTFPLQFLYWFSDNEYIKTSQWPRSWYIWTPAIVGSFIASGTLSCLSRVPMLSMKKTPKKTPKKILIDMSNVERESNSLCLKKLHKIGQLKASIILHWYSRNNKNIGKKNCDSRDNKNIYKKNKYLDKISSYLDDSRNSVLTILIAINALAKIIDEFREGRIKRLAKDKRAFYRELRQRAVKLLKSVAERKKICARKNFSLKNIYANYSLWSNGISYQNRGNSFFWIPKTLLTIFLLYGKYRLLLSIVQPLIEYFNFKINEYECARKSKVYVYTQSSGNYECTICGDWPEVYYKNIFDAQSCIDALLQTAQPIEKVIMALKRVLPFDISNINFSHQRWYEWSEVELQTVFKLIQRISNGLLNTFTLGSSQEMLRPLSNNQTAIIIDAFKKFEAKNINLAGSYFPVNATAQILNSISNITSTLNLSRMHLGKPDALSLSQSIFNLTSLNIFIADDNLFENDAMRLLSLVLYRMNLTELSLAGNIFDENGIAEFSKYPFPNLQKLNLSDLNLKTSNLTSIAPLLKNPNLTEFIFRNSGVNTLNLPTFINALTQSNLKKLDLSVNYLTSYAGYTLGAAVQNSTVNTLLLNGNPFSDNGVAYLAEFLPDSPIKKLALNRVEVSDAGLRVFSQKFPQSKIVDLDLSENQITELGMRYFAPSFKSVHNITRIVLDGNNIGDEGLTLLLESINKHQGSLRTISLHDTGITHIYLLFENLHNTTCLETLRLSNNNLEISDYVKALKKIKELSVKNIDLSGTGITNSIGKVLIQQLPGSTITNLKLNDNILGNDLIGDLGKQLVVVPISKKSLMKKYVNSENMRIIRAARPNTELTKLSLQHVNIATEVAREICRLLPSTEIDIKFLFLDNNFIDESQVNLMSCYVSSASRAKLPTIFLLIERMTSDAYKLLAAFLQKLTSNTAITFASTDSSAIVPFVPLHNNKPDIFLDCVVNNEGLLQCRGMVKNSNGEISYFSVMARVMQDQFPVIRLKKLFFNCVAAIVFAFRDEVLQLSKPFTESLFKKYFPKSFSLEDLIWLSKFYNASHESILINEFGSMIIRANCDPVSVLAHDVTCVVKKVVKNTQTKSVDKLEGVMTKSAQALLVLGGGFGTACAINYLTGNSLIGFTLMPFISKVPKICTETLKSYNKNGFWSAANTALEEFCCAVPGGSYVMSVSGGK